MVSNHADALRNSIAALVTGKVDLGAGANGTLVLIDASGNTVATCAFQKPAFQTPIAGVAMANTIARDVAPVVGATPVRYEVRDCDGIFVWRGAMGPGQDLGDTGLPIAANTPVNIQNFFYRAPF